MPKFTIHYTPADSISSAPICGKTGGRWSTVTTDPVSCTCKGCKQSTLFKRRFPDLVKDLAPTGKPPIAEGVQKTVKFYLPPRLVEWFDEQGSYAGTVVRGLEELHDREVKSRRKAR